MPFGSDYLEAHGLDYNMSMRWLAALLYISVSACSFDTSTKAASAGAIDADRAAIDADPAAIDADPAAIDADTSLPDASAIEFCQSECTGTGASCDPDGTCVFTCEGATDCNNISCPQGMPCRVICIRSAGKVCNNIECPDGMPCEVTCTDNTGQDLRVCNNVNCNDSCACDVTCSNSTGACKSTNCTLGACFEPATDNCRSSPNNCDTCDTQ